MLRVMKTLHELIQPIEEGGEERLIRLSSIQLETIIRRKYV